MQASSAERLSLTDGSIRTIIWATGYARSFGWLEPLALGGDGELAHQGGVTSVPGLYALGARAGLNVLAIDRKPYGSDTLSTHALMRPAVLQLWRWGLLEPLLKAGTPLIETTTFHYGDDEITVPLASGSDLPGLIAPRRTVLDRILV
ncbi:MAG: hypothetical protein E5V52_16600, partial [Mesorhizobium sp.]